MRAGGKANGGYPHRVMLDKSVDALA